MASENQLDVAVPDANDTYLARACSRSDTCLRNARVATNIHTVLGYAASTRSPAPQGDTEGER